MQVQELLEHKNPVCSISLAESVYAAARMMTEEDVGLLAVLGREQRLVGVISERDIVTKVVNRQLDPNRIAVGEVMSTNLVVASPVESLENCEERMRRAHCRHVVIIDRQKLIAVISLRDILDSSFIAKEGEVLVDEKMIWNGPKSARNAVSHSAKP